MAAHGGASGRVQAHASERELAARGRREAEELALPDQARLLLLLQQAAGNQAVSNLLHRKVRIAPSTGWATRTGQHALPQMPARFLAQRGILDRVSGLVYVTAHYDVGSIAWLSGVPGALVSNWSKKAKDYTRLLRK